MEALTTYSVDVKLYEELFEALTPLYNYFKVPKQNNAIQFFQLENIQAYFTTQADSCSQLLFNSSSPVHFWNHSGVKSEEPAQTCLKILPLNVKLFQEIVYILLTQQFNCVELYTFSKNGMKLEAFATPGCVDGLIELVPQLENIVTYKASIEISDNRVCMMYADGQMINIIKFDDDSTLSKLCSSLFQLQIRECIFAPNTDLERTMNQLNIRYQIINEKELKEPKMNAEIKMKIKSVSQSELAPMLVGMLIQNPVDVNQLSLVDTMQLQQKDAEQLELNELIKLFKAHLQTDTGRANFEKLFFRPLLQKEIIEKRQEFVNQLLDNREYAKVIRQTNGMNTINKNLRKSKEICRTSYDLFCQIDGLNQLMNVTKNLFTKTQLPEFEILNTDYELTLNEIRQLILKYIVPNPSIFSAFENQVILINPNLQSNLVDKFNSLIELNKLIQQENQDLIQKLNLDNPQHCKLQSTAQNKLSFKIPYYLLKQVQEISDVQIVDKKTTGIKAVTRTLQDLNTQFLEQYAVYQQLSANFVIELEQNLYNYLTQLNQIQELISTADFLSSLSLTSKKHSFSRPDMSSKHIIHANAFNPVLINSQRFIQPNSFTQQNNLLIITGANSGGKSQLLKQIGNCQILAQLGSNTPGHIQTRVFDNLCLRFGSSDSLESGISTFMGEMLQVSQILSVATENSLVLVDELGRGTSQNDGYGLTIGVAEHLLGLNCVSVFVTHVQEVTKKLPAQFLRMRSEIVNGNLKLTYKVENGIDESHGIEVAKMCGINQEIIDDANEWERIRRNGAGGIDNGQSKEYDKMLIMYQLGLINKEQLKDMYNE
ncbi:MutS_domain-containing protein [Hexamita inflata]|uniref:MutS domain-containing protein n=1 Tax=Hexamita inflata TaxID=28002 RepID=A0AA86R0X0_9EUKA|nr:MutS domain-containing protein [Hexamita inflata]